MNDSPTIETFCGSVHGRICEKVTEHQRRLDKVDTDVKEIVQSIAAFRTWLMCTLVGTMASLIVGLVILILKR